MMKRIILLILSLLSVVALVIGCGSAKDETPSAVVIAAYTAGNEGRYSETEKYLSSELLQVTKGELGSLFGGLKVLWDVATNDGTIQAIEIVEEKVRGEGAVVTFKLYFKDGSMRDDYEALIKEDGVWKIAMG